MSWKSRGTVWSWMCSGDLNDKDAGIVDGSVIFN